ncbi:hypothetical protein MJH12_10970, partial [bacterium]|nr:hypothetical protein [bacterium]
MKNISKILLSICLLTPLGIPINAEDINANDINLSTQQKDKIIATVIGSNSEIYSLIVKGDEYSASLYVQLDDGESVTILGGDSTPFPLSRFGVKYKVAQKLADEYVKYEVAHTPGGLATIKKRLDERKHLPHDLLEAYSKLMSLSIKPFYAKQYTQLNEVIKSMQALLSQDKSSDVNDFVARELRPLRYVTLESISNK